jgi:hypothetical protein
MSQQSSLTQSAHSVRQVLTAYTPMGVDLLTQHKRLVEAKLHEYAAEPTVWSKYHWVARYHNFFCKDCGPSLPLRYRVVDQDAAFESQRIRKQEGSEK